MNLLWPIIVILAGACGWWLIRYLNAPKPFEVGLICIVVLLLILWLLGIGGIWIDRPAIHLD